MADTEVLGIGDLKLNFQRVREDMKLRTSRRMVVAAGGVLKRRAKANALAAGLRKTGSLVKNIVIKRETKAPEGTTQYNLGVRHGRNMTKKQKANSLLGVGRSGRIVKRYEDDPYYWRFLEFDTSRRSATPFLGPALQDGKEQAIEAMATAGKKDLEKVGAP